MKLVVKTHTESAMHFRMRGGCKEQLCHGAAESRDVDISVTQAREVSMWGSAGHRVQEEEESWKSTMKPHKGSDRVALKIGTVTSVPLFPFPQPHCACSVTQSCPTVCDSVDCSLPGSPVHEISQARVLE